tara:strand:+ start:129 stop:335 length:207 start_codon:yes stop_codon:yes gene_type:complete
MKMSKYVCKDCGNENISYQVWVDEDGKFLEFQNDIDWQVAYAKNGQAWCEGEDGCGEIFGVVGRGVRV